MRGIIVVIVSVVLLMAFNVSCTKTAEQSSTDKDFSLETLQQKSSYIMGYQQGRGLKMRQMEDEMDLNIMLQGMKDGIKGEPKIEEKDHQKIMQEFYKGFRERQEAKSKVQGEKNKIEGEKFLEENAKKTGITVTDSGLQYQVIKEGSGPKPKATDTVEVHYIGTLIDGTEFDSSHKRGQPAKFPLNRVIPAWTEGLQLMTVGSKYKFFAPANLAYGDKGPGIIGPNAVLIFEVELLGIEPPKEEKPGQTKAQQPQGEK